MGSKYLAFIPVVNLFVYIIIQVSFFNLMIDIFKKSFKIFKEIYLNKDVICVISIVFFLTLAFSFFINMFMLF